jgi:hypothetical protein
MSLAQTVEFTATLFHLVAYQQGINVKGNHVPSPPSKTAFCGSTAEYFEHLCATSGLAEDDVRKWTRGRSDVPRYAISALKAAGGRPAHWQPAAHWVAQAEEFLAGDCPALFRAFDANETEQAAEEIADLLAKVSREMSCVAAAEIAVDAWVFDP